MRWSAPSIGSFKISTFSKQQGTKFASGGLIRDGYGNCLYALGLYSESSCLLSSECDVLHECLRICLSKGIMSITIESNSRALGKMISHGLPPWRLDHIWGEIQKLLLHFSTKFEYVLQECNEVARFLAKKALTHSASFGISDGFCCSSFRALLILDMVCPHIRMSRASESH